MSVKIPVAVDFSKTVMRIPNFDESVLKLLTLIDRVISGISLTRFDQEQHNELMSLWQFKNQTSHERYRNCYNKMTLNVSKLHNGMVRVYDLRTKKNIVKVGDQVEFYNEKGERIISPIQNYFFESKVYNKFVVILDKNKDDIIEAQDRDKKPDLLEIIEFYLGEKNPYIRERDPATSATDAVTIRKQKLEKMMESIVVSREAIEKSKESYLPLENKKEEIEHLERQSELLDLEENKLAGEIERSVNQEDKAILEGNLAILQERKTLEQERIALLQENTARLYVLPSLHTRPHYGTMEEKGDAKSTSLYTINQKKMKPNSILI